MAAPGYEFYLRELKVCNVLFILYILMPFPHNCNWLIMSVTMATPISSHVKDNNGIFTSRGEDMTF